MRSFKRRKLREITDRFKKQSEPSQHPIRPYLFTQILCLFPCLNKNHICIRTYCKGVSSGSSLSSQPAAKLHPDTAISKYAKIYSLS